jgi:hypothetical protein
MTVELESHAVLIRLADFDWRDAAERKVGNGVDSRQQLQHAQLWSLEIEQLLRRLASDGSARGLDTAELGLHFCRATISMGGDLPEVAGHSSAAYLNIDQPVPQSLGECAGYIRWTLPVDTTSASRAVYGRIYGCTSKAFAISFERY